MIRYGPSRRAPYIPRRTRFSVAAAAGQLFLQQVDDAVDVTDSALKWLGLGQGDATTIQDGMSKLVGKFTDDRTDLSDDINKLIGIVTSDRVDATDELISMRLVGIVLADALDVLDSFVKSLGINQSDNPSVEDAAIKLIDKAVADDQIDIADAVAGIKLFARSIVDSLDVFDAFDKTIGKAFPEDVGVIDEPTKLIFKNLLDQVDLVDEVLVQTVLQAILVTLEDSVGVYDDFTKRMFIGMSEQTIVEDAIGKMLGIALRDEVALADEVNGVRVLIRDMLDSLDIFDTTHKFVGKVMGEGVEVIDTLYKLLQKTVDDETSILDDSSPTKTIIKSLNDLLDVTDAVSFARILVRVLTDEFSLSDSMSQSIAKVLTDDCSVEDRINKMLALILNDDAQVTDEITVQVIRAIVIIAAYLDTMLTATTDNPVGRQTSERDVMPRLTQVKDAIGRIIGGKGFRR